MLFTIMIILEFKTDGPCLWNCQMGHCKMLFWSLFLPKGQNAFSAQASLISSPELCIVEGYY